MKTSSKLPELLSPAGSPDALRAAVAGGADAVYFGAKSFSARSFAENFDDKALEDAAAYCRTFGVRTYLTVNIQLFDRELEDACALIKRAYEAGVDAFITADLGLARIISENYPEVELHASTQMSGQNALSAQELCDLGFTRMVVPREISARNLSALCKSSPIETEMFIHGALCVSHSGQCLFSSVIGGRSGNRGECAQPCRLEYNCKNCRYPLSLKDLCLAGRMSEIIESGVTSLKIEGRMKSPDYVYGVTEIYRRLLDERRDATESEIESLSRLFSRSGFTCGYYTGKVDGSMLGVRTDADKRASAQSADTALPQKKIPLDISAKFAVGEPAEVSGGASIGGAYTVRTVYGASVQSAKEGQMSENRVRASLCKLGSTVFAANPDDVRLEISGAATMPVAEINALRRALCDELISTCRVKRALAKINISETKSAPGLDLKTAYFARAAVLSEDSVNYFDRVFVPLGEYKKVREEFSSEKIGVAFPPVALDFELDSVKKDAAEAKALGCKYALVTGLWQISVGRMLGFEMTGDLRLNCFNSHSSSALSELGIMRQILSVEVPLSRARAVRGGMAEGIVVYGRLPLMTLEKCVVREIMGIKCDRGECRFCDGGKFTVLEDRVGAKFLVCRAENHRNIIYNSVPVWMADKRDEISSAGLFAHFIFTDESPAEIKRICSDFDAGARARGQFKRI